MNNWQADGRTTTQRGYGNQHQKDRARAAKQHQPTDPCVRCGHPLGPMGKWLHYDHKDNRSEGYLGFSHGSPCPTCGKRCNVRAGAQTGRAKQDRPTLRW